MDKKPNFLFIITDQHRADHLGCYGNSVVNTPHIDALAARGTRFDRFYTATPICMPNRATLMTGRMPSLHGSRHNGIPLSMNATTFVDIMRAAGYDTALIGKCHLQSMSGGLPTIGMPEPDLNKVQPPEHLREADRSWLTHGRYDQELRSTWNNDPGFELTLPYYGFSHVDLAVGHGDEVVGHYARWLKARRSDADLLRGRKNQLPGNDYVAKICIRRATSPSAPLPIWNGMRAPAPSRSFSSALFPIRITRLLRRANTGICTIPKRSLCRRHTMPASIRFRRIYKRSTPNGSRAKQTATASALLPLPNGKPARPSPSPTA
jgi:hypothetical protein